MLPCSEFLWHNAVFLLETNVFVLFATWLYNLYFHPLSRFPGPFWARSSSLWRLSSVIRGHHHRDIQYQHALYGPVVRIAPNELSFGSRGAYKDIYGPWPTQKPFLKSNFYDIFGAGFESRCIGSERDVNRHTQMKRLLSPAFSNSALLRQEDVIQHTIDQFVAKIRDEADGTGRALNMTDWYEMLAFDLLGEMAFGESFNCVRDSAPHPWQQLIAKHLFWIDLISSVRAMPPVRMIIKLAALFVSPAQSETSKFCREKLARRLERRPDRYDFLSDIIAGMDEKAVSQEELTAHASTLAIAGGETVATFMAAVTYYLCKNPGCKVKLEDEIRAEFKNYNDITASRAQKLPYLQACIQEGLRIYSPSALGLPRISPGASVDGVWVPKDTECYVSNYTVTHDATNFWQPYEFLPQRWLAKDIKQLKQASQPFSCGPRGCIGKSFAYIEMSLILTKMLYVFEMELEDPKLDWEGDSRIHIQWWKPKLYVGLKVRSTD